MIYLRMKKKNKNEDRKKLLEEEMRKNLLRRKVQQKKIDKQREGKLNDSNVRQLDCRASKKK